MYTYIYTHTYQPNNPLLPMKIVNCNFQDFRIATTSTTCNHNSYHCVVIAQHYILYSTCNHKSCHFFIVKECRSSGNKTILIYPS